MTDAAARDDSALDGPVDCEVDARGLTCPMPLLKAKRALNGLADGATLRICATDPGSVRDFEVFCERSGHQLLVSGVDGETFVHVLRKQLTA